MNWNWTFTDEPAFSHSPHINLPEFTDDNLIKAAKSLANKTTFGHNVTLCVLLKDSCELS